jgi:hypothetical protein
MAMLRAPAMYIPTDMLNRYTEVPSDRMPSDTCERMHRYDSTSKAMRNWEEVSIIPSAAGIVLRLAVAAAAAAQGAGVACLR